ncbi:MAG: sulfatase-like hydrolase/transferase, partial [Polyangiaceae bacterium]|nr:sulfatase-like hydrolase/transferase [Polyangiaceae bacterium]
PQVLSKGLEVLEKRSASSRPLFLWIHFYDIHSEYLDHPGQTSFGKERLDTYDGEILFTDGHVGRFLAALFAEKNRQQIVLLTADHGDGFQSDRGRLNHGYGLWNEQIHVPMVVWAPGAEPRRVDTPVSNLDIMATALNAAGIEARDVMGRSLFPYLYEGFRDPDRIVFAIEPYREGAVWHERSVAIGMRWRLHRFKRDGQQALHDFDSDPGEKVNLVRKQPAVADALGKELDDLVQQVDAYRLRYERAPDEPVRPNTR